MKPLQRPSSTRQQPQLRSKKPVRVALYVIVSLIGLLAVFTYFFFVIEPKNLGTTVVTGNTTREIFNGLYQIGWRSDGSAGNTAIETVYYYPALFQILSQYTERTSLQNQTFGELSKYPDMFLYPFLMTFQHNEAIDTDFQVESYVTLTADGTARYDFDHWQPLVLPDTSGTSLAGVLWFKKPAGVAEPKILRMTVDGISGNKKESQFSWDNSMLLLIDFTAKNQ
ncbi:MAG: hypothetical protein V1907_03420 [Candidatus Kerfeldbacteria bacterium]